jgi:hypothetical protein
MPARNISKWASLTAGVAEISQQKPASCLNGGNFEPLVFKIDDYCQYFFLISFVSPSNRSNNNVCSSKNTGHEKLPLNQLK